MTLPDDASCPAAPNKGEPGSRWFQDLIPDIESRSEAYRTSLDAVDDEVLLLFSDQMRLIINALRTAIAAGNMDDVRRQAHSLQGMGGTAGAPEISVVGEELSRCAKQMNLERCGEPTARLEQWQTSWIPALTSGSQHADMPAIPRLTGRILVVDDELPNRRFLKKFLSESGAEVIEASDGEQALDLARQLGPDVALVDVLMPGLSGYDVCRRLTEDPATRHIAVIMVTARSTVEDVEHAFVLGAFDYIRKPFHARELLARVCNALQIKRQNDELRQWQARMTRELDAAGALQRKLLATDPFFSPAIEVRSGYQSSMSVGGDVFDTIKLPDGRVCVYVGDVAGHGVGPAMISTLLKAVVNEVAREYAARGPAAMCNEIHRRFRYYVTNAEVYATLFIAIFDATGRRCITFNCGHPMPLMFDANGDALPPFADRGGLPIGLPSGNGVENYSSSDEVQADLPPGAAMCVFTDGLLEARQAEDAEPCGAENLGALLAAVARDPAIIDPSREILRRLTDQGYQLAKDDCTLLVVRTLDPAGLRLERAIAPTHAQVAELAEAVEQVFRREGWPEEAAGAAQLLVMEHGANVVDHGETPPGSRIDLQLRLSGNLAWLLFRDEGREWDFQDRLAFSLRQPEDSIRGRGLRMIKAIARHIDVVRRDHENDILYVVARDFVVGDTNGCEQEPVS